MRARKAYMFLIVVLMAHIHTPFTSAADPVVISINAVAGLQFDLVRFKVKPGSSVKLIFTNNDDMSHNLVITLPGAREEVVNAALNLGDKGPGQHFIPESPKILWSVPVLSPAESKVVTFDAPAEEGVYPYVCTYPGHGFIMYGAMYVTNGDMPPIGEDQHIDASRRTESTAGTGKSGHDHGQAVTGAELTRSGHPYNPVAPYMYRVFIEGAGPAAIAVRLPHGLSYCWDAGSCRLRYAWAGEFLDLTDFWKGHQDAQAKVMGEIFYQDQSAFPLRVGSFDKIPKSKFKGYRLVNRYPEFCYELDGIEIYEMLIPKEDGTGLIRKFRIPESDKAVWFTFYLEDGVIYTTSKGKLIRKRIKLTPAREFSIIMTKKNNSEP